MYPVRTQCVGVRTGYATWRVEALPDGGAGVAIFVNIQPYPTNKKVSKQLNAYPISKNHQQERINKQRIGTGLYPKLVITELKINILLFEDKQQPTDQT